MAKRRKLKKNINYIASELFADCLFCSMAASEEKKEKIDQVIDEILQVRDEFVSRLSHIEKSNVKGFYKKFQADFNTKVGEIIGSIEGLGAN